MTCRLDKALARGFGLTRSTAAAAIRRGQVLVCGSCCRDPALQVEAGAVLCYDGQVCSAEAACATRTFMLHKPVGMVCANRDARWPTVLQLLTGERHAERLHCVGRLDIDASGLLLLTEDGALLHRLTAPRRGIAKVYEVVTDRPIPATAAADMAAGLRHPLESRAYRAARLELCGSHAARITICEGRFHEVKRLFACLGLQVRGLQRVQIGTLRLDPRLAPGQYRRLEPAELAQLCAATPGAGAGTVSRLS